jgi:two-component system cell cycle response regulator
METIAVAWIVPHAQFDLGDLPSLMLARGFRIDPQIAGTAIAGGTAVRVLQADLFRDMRSMREEYEADRSVATLLVASTPEHVRSVLEFLSGNDDVVVGTHPVDLLAFRLRRLCGHASNLARIDYLQTHDSLTGVLNRRHFQSVIEACLAENRAGAAAYALVMLDIDHFKQLNDRFGHAAGDAALVEIARLMQDGASPGDRFSRFGGEEFLFWISRYDSQTAVAEVTALLARVAAYGFRCGGSVFSLTASAGMTFVGADRNFDLLVQRADNACYAAKAAGRNRLVVHEQWQADLDADNRDSRVETFKNVSRVLNERITAAVTRFGARLVEDARREANHDALTALPNRRYFERRFPREFERAVGQHRALALAMMDLDFFGEVNRKFGFQTGDKVLRSFADIATANVRSLDWIARVGGEEFWLVTPDASLDVGAQVAERIRASVEAAKIESLGQEHVPLTVSIGVVQLSRDDTPGTLMGRANNALRKAKEGGRNRVVAE